MPHAHVHNKIVYRTVMANSVLAASGRRSTFINAKFLLNLDAKFVPVIGRNLARKIGPRSKFCIAKSGPNC